MRSLIGVFCVLFATACAKTTYVPRANGLIHATPIGYYRDGEFYKKGAGKKGLVKATEPDEQALGYAKKSSKNMKLAHGLTYGGLAMSAGGIGISLDNNSPSKTKGIVSLSLLGAGIISMLMSLLPERRSVAQEADAINIYNDLKPA